MSQFSNVHFPESRSYCNKFLFMAVIRYVNVTHIIKHGRRNQADYTYGAFIFICYIEKYLIADGKLPRADC